MNCRAPKATAYPPNFGKSGGYAIALGALHNTFRFQLLKYLCITMSAGAWEPEKNTEFRQKWWIRYRFRSPTQYL
jgi:hypothetical protein